LDTDAKATGDVEWNCFVEALWSKSGVKLIDLACQLLPSCRKTLTHIFAITWPKTVNTIPIMPTKTANLILLKFSQHTIS